MQEIRIPVGNAWISASIHGEGPSVVALGHGAGGTRRTGLLVRFAEALADAGRRVLLYNFPYAEERRRRPDPTERLESTARAVGDHALGALGAARLVHGGKSMGGRIASQAVAAGARADGLVFLGYPLHPPGRTEALRDAHLPKIEAPMLFLQGTRDAFARWDLIEAAAAPLGERATLHRVDGADHSFAVLRGSGRTGEDVERELVRATLDWLGRHGL